jgi:hypothetical protein
MAIWGVLPYRSLSIFLRPIGVPIPCSFEIYNFGPYSEEVTRSVSALLADEAIVDVSLASKYSSYKMPPASGDFDHYFLAETGAYRGLIDSIVRY